MNTQNNDYERADKSEPLIDLAVTEEQADQATAGAGVEFKEFTITKKTD
jgi:hypothetical protein